MMKWYMFLLLLGLMVTAVPRFGEQAPYDVVELRLNEIDYKQGSLPGNQFIEIVNKGDATANLSDYNLRLIDGRGGQAVVYQTINLPQATLAPGDYFVLCNSATVINCDYQFTGIIQESGPGAVALMLSSAVIDTVSYEGNTPSPYTEGSGVGLADDGVGYRSIARFPNGLDNNQNNVDFSPRCITPGLANREQDTDCERWLDPAQALEVMVSALPTAVPEPGGPVTITAHIANQSIFNIDLHSLTANGGQNLHGVGNCLLPQILTGFASYTCHFTTDVIGLFGEEIGQTVTAVGRDDFNRQVMDSGQTAVSISQRIRWDIYLPLLQSPRPYGEPNNTCSQAYPLLLNQTYSFLAEDRDDWYSVDLPQQGVVRIHWLNFIPQEGQIILYRGECQNLAIVANNGQTAVNRILDAGSQPAGRYYIRIISDALPNNQDAYTLRVQFP